MTTLDTLRECHRIVWQYRRELEAVWPTPDTEDALLFAFTELGEAIDAHLRLKGGYARNNVRELDVLDELADCAMMVLTAIGPDDFDDAESYWWCVGHFDMWYGSHKWNIYAQDAADIVYWQAHGDLLAEGYPLRFLSRIATHPGMDLPARLTARLERIKAKRLPQSEAADLDLEYTWISQAGSL